MRHVSAVILFIAAAQLAAAADPQAVVWQPVKETNDSDWRWGVGGEEGAPLAPFDFVSEDFSGTNPKLRVRDARGAQWTVKFGSEVHSEVFVSRLLYTSGYAAAPIYFVEAGAIRNAQGLKRVKPYLGKGGQFRNGRFKLASHGRLPRAKDVEWTWQDHPDTEIRHWNGLKILMMLTSNWDAKDARDRKGNNTGVYVLSRSPSILLYSVDDWGASMGKWGGFFARDRWDAAGYSKQSRDFVKLGARGSLRWGYGGKHGRDINSGISSEDARWLLQQLRGATKEHLAIALKASGGSSPDSELLASAILARIKMLRAVVKDAVGSELSAQK